MVSYKIWFNFCFYFWKCIYRRGRTWLQSLETSEPLRGLIRKSSAPSSKHLENQIKKNDNQYPKTQNPKIQKNPDIVPVYPVGDIFRWNNHHRDSLQCRRLLHAFEEIIPSQLRHAVVGDYQVNHRCLHKQSTCRYIYLSIYRSYVFWFNQPTNLGGSIPIFAA